MRVCIDINSVTPLLRDGFLTGIGRSTLDLILALAELGDAVPFEIVLYSQNTKGRSGRKLNLPFKNRHLFFPYGDKYNRVLSCLPVKEVFLNYDLLHIPHNAEYLHQPHKTVVTLHDALFMKLDEPHFNHRKVRSRVPAMLKQVRAIITCSASSKRDIVETMGVAAERITVVPWGISKDRFHPEAEAALVEFRKQRQLDRPFFAAVSCSVGRKNTVSLLRAFKQYLLAGGQHDLVLVWGRPPAWLVQEFQTEVASQRIHFLTHLSDVQLRCLYSGAVATFFPSKYEGFGFPVLESLACGTPVVTCRNSSLPEVGGDVALYTDPEDLDRMAQYMVDFERGVYDVAQLRQAGLAHAARYSWQKTAAAYVDFYKKSLGYVS